MPDLFVAAAPELEPAVPPRGWAARAARVRVAAYLIACDGYADLADLRAFLRRHGRADRPLRKPKLEHGSSGSSLGALLQRDLRPLRELGLIVREGDGYSVRHIGDLADWLADELHPEGVEVLDA